MTQQLQEKQDTIQIAAAIESLLFVSGRPLEYAELRKLLNVDDTGLTGGLDLLDDQLESQGRGIRLQRLGEQVQLVTAPENARYIAALLDLPMTATAHNSGHGNACGHLLSPTYHSRTN